MKSTVAQSFSGFTPQHWKKLVHKLAQRGVAVAGPSGRQRHFGFELAWHYDPDGQQLEVRCLERPLFIPEPMVEARLRQFVEGCMKPPRPAA